MTNDAEAQEVHATITDAGHSQEPANGGQAQRPDVLDGDVADDEDITDEDITDDDENIDDEDADGEDIVVIEGMSVVRADDETSPVSADDGVSPPDADDELSRDQVTSAPAATTAPDAARAGMPVGAGPSAGPGRTPVGAGTSADAGSTPAAAGMPSDTDVPADTNMVGDPEKLHQQWAAIQSTFVDDPRGSVAAAAEFVTGTIAALVASAQEREQALRGEWDRDGVDTEGLRNALRSYRGLLDQLARV
jgi:hypothetical protein